MGFIYKRKTILRYSNASVNNVLLCFNFDGKNGPGRRDCKKFDGLNFQDFPSSSYDHVRTSLSVIEGKF